MKKTKDIERFEEILASGTKVQRSDAAYQLYWNPAVNEKK